MAILSIVPSQTGEAGVLPSYASILTNDTEAEILTTGYLNQAVQNGASFHLPCIAKISTKATSTSDYQVGWYQVVHVGSNWSVVVAGNPGDVVLPTVANQLVHATDATGTLSTAAANVVNLGNITAGSSAVAGSLTSFAGTGSTEFLRLAAINNTGGNFSTTISNIASVGQSQTISIPDLGAATGNFILSANAGTQNITAGALQVNAGAISGGLLAGGFAGSLVLWANTTASGNLALLAVDNGTGDFDTVISNAAAVGQDQVITIPDSGAATANFLLSSSATVQNITAGNFQVDAGSLISGLAGGGFAGSYIGYSNTNALGSLRLLTVDNAGNFAVTISNASHGQSSVVSIPDGGQATAEFIISDSAGTQHITSGGFQVDAGAISTGLSAGGFVGRFDAYPTTTASGILSMVAAVNATGDFDTTISNSTAVAQDQVITIPDVGAATGSFLVNVLTDSDPAADIVSFDVTVTAAALATGGTVTLQASSGTKQYKIRELFLNSGGTNFSGGGGDRLATISDGTTSYSVIPAANLQALTNERWGTTAVPYPAAAAINTSTAAGVALTIAYSGGASDYGAGSMVISGIAERVA